MRLERGAAVTYGPADGRKREGLPETVSTATHHFH